MDEQDIQDEEQDAIFPNTDGGLLAWSASFSNLINADPAAYGLSASAAADYQASHAAFAAALAAADPAIRSRTTTAGPLSCPSCSSMFEFFRFRPTRATIWNGNQ